MGTKTDRSDFVPRQIAAIEELQEIERILDGKQDMMEKGCSPRMVIEFARNRNLAVSTLHNGKLLESISGSNPPLVAALHENHLYFYAGRARKKFINWRSDRKDVVVRLRREHKANATTPPTNEWLPFKYEADSGHFYASEESMPAIRAWFLKEHRCPRVVLRDLATIGGVIPVHASTKERTGA